MNELEYRLCNVSMPIRAGMADMITLFSLQEDPDIEDIYIPPNKRPIIYVNPIFIGRYCKTDEHLFIFVLSEVYRLRLCQTSSFQGESKETEIAADLGVPRRTVSGWARDISTPSLQAKSIVLKMRAASTGTKRAGSGWVEPLKESGSIS